MYTRIDKPTRNTSGDFKSFRRKPNSYVDLYIYVSGPVIGLFCMDLAIKKAKEAGIGWVSARGAFYLHEF